MSNDTQHTMAVPRPTYITPEATRDYQRLLRDAISHDDFEPFPYSDAEVLRIIREVGSTIASFQETVCRRRKDNESDDREPLRTRRTL